jgi:hypothetical protein
MLARAYALTGRLPGHRLALGGGGLAHWIIRLIIWHEIWRLVRYLWRIPTFGPFIVIALVVVLVGLMIWRQVRGPGRRQDRDRGRGEDVTGYGTGSGPRDW